MNLTRPLTPAQARLIRIHLALIPVYGWLLFVWTSYAVDIGVRGRLDRSGHIKGHDFAHFYVLGEIANDHAGQDLYSFEAQARRMDALVPDYENRFLPVHAPQVAMFFAPLAGWTYGRAVTLWLLLSAGIYGACCYAMWATFPNLHRYGWIVALLAAAFPAFYSLISSGQTSSFALLWFTMGFFALRHERQWLAGVILGSLVYKPTLVLLLPLAFLYAGQYKVLIGAFAAALLQFGVAWAYFGTGTIASYINNFRAAVSSTSLLEVRPEFMHSLKSFFSILLPWPEVAMAAYAATAILVAAIAVRTWKTKAPLQLRYAVLLLATVLVNPHVYTYELVVLTPAFILVACWAVERCVTATRLWLVMGFCYALPALDSLTSLTGIQWSVPALTALTVIVALAARVSPSEDQVGVVS